MTLPSADAFRPSSFPFARRHPRLFLGIYIFAGVLATTALLWFFIAIAEDIPEQGALTRVDMVVARWLEARVTEGGESLFNAVSILGAPVLVACIVAATIRLTWRRVWLDAIALLFATGSGILLSTTLKLIFHRGRPETATEFITLQSWSFPSGHAMNSVIGYGFLALLAHVEVGNRRMRRTVVIATVLLVGMIGFSRLYLGVHYLSDVIGGWLAGSAWLIICATGYHFAKRWDYRTASHQRS